MLNSERERRLMLTRSRVYCPLPHTGTAAMLHRERLQLAG